MYRQKVSGQTTGQLLDLFPQSSMMEKLASKANHLALMICIVHILVSMCYFLKRLRRARRRVRVLDADLSTGFQIGASNAWTMLSSPC